MQLKRKVPKTNTNILKQTWSNLMTSIFNNNTSSAKNAKSQNNSTESAKGYSTALNGLNETLNILQGVQNGKTWYDRVKPIAALLS